MELRLRIAGWHSRQDRPARRQAWPRYLRAGGTDAVRRISHGLTFNVFLDHLLDVAIEELAWFGSVDADVLDDDVAIGRAEAIVAHLTDLPHEDRGRAKEVLERRLPITDDRHRDAVMELVAHLSDDDTEDAAKG